MKDINRKLFISKKQLQKLLEEFAVEEIAAQKKFIFQQYIVL